MSTPLASIPKGATGAGSIAAAAQAALTGIDHPNGNEQAGVILKGPDGKFYPTAPVSNGQDQFSLRLELQHGWSIAGIYHNHPGDNEGAQYFSPDDIRVANQFKVPSYILFAKDKAIRSYTPGQTQLSNFPDPNGSRFPLHVSRGDPLIIPQQQQASTAPIPAAPPVAPAAPVASIPTNNIQPISSSPSSVSQ